MKGMEDTALLERIARAIHSPTFGNRVDYPLPIDFHTASRVLAALGLDDLDAAVERARNALPPPDGYRRIYMGRQDEERLIVHRVLKAALTATEEGQS